MSAHELKRLFGAGAQLFQQRRFAEAARAFRRATELAPASAPAWCNLAAALVESREPVEALAAADRALALDPGFAPAHANRGDALRLGKFPLEQCRDAYRRAVELQPRSPDLLNKLGTTLLALGEIDAAGEMLGRAVALAPAYALARLNFGTLLLLQGRSAEARALAREALEAGTSNAADRGAFADALAIIDANLAREPALRAAVATRSPQGFVSANRSPSPGAGACDEALLARMGECLRRWSGRDSGHTSLDPRQSALNDLLEAHFSAHLGDDAGAARGTEAFLRAWGGRARAEIPQPVDAKLLDAHNYFDAIAHQRDLSGAERCDAANVVAWLRYWHAFLTSHRQEVGPGALKAFQNSVIINPDIERTAPAMVQDTLERAFTELYARERPGVARAALVYFIIIDVHPFADGNGRLSRFLMNRELVAAGLSPVVNPLHLKPMFGKALRAARLGFDLGPFVEWLAACDAYTAGVRAELGHG